MSERRAKKYVYAHVLGRTMLCEVMPLKKPTPDKKKPVASAKKGDVS